jgi:hypothetical protein
VAIQLNVTLLKGPIGRAISILRDRSLEAAKANVVGAGRLSIASMSSRIGQMMRKFHHSHPRITNGDTAGRKTRPSRFISILSVSKSKFAELSCVPDAHWISLKPQLEGLMVSSKFYGIAAAGRPNIAITAKDGEIAHLQRSTT